MKAYKALNVDLTCKGFKYETRRGFQYEIDKIYEIDEEPVPYGQGFHACKNLDDVFNHYPPINKIRIYEVELDGDIVKNDDLYAANKITIVNEIDYAIFKATSKNICHRMMCARYGTDKDLDILVHDNSKYVRKIVAEQGRNKDLDILVHDSDKEVRLAVAYNGRNKDLDVLVNDDYYYIRTVVAHQGRPKDLDILVYDKSNNVRKAVANQGRKQDLDILINDESYIVRKAVARFKFN